MPRENELENRNKPDGVLMYDPDDSGLEAVTDECGRTVAHRLAESDALPRGFTRWSIADVDGWTVAHILAEFGSFPPEFNQWELADHEGWTVAHVAARFGKLPPGYDNWELADEDGWSVAHEAASSGNLPSGFRNLDIVDNAGATVREVMSEAPAQAGCAAQFVEEFIVVPASQLSELFLCDEDFTCESGSNEIGEIGDDASDTSYAVPYLDF
jgi:hypothetical protein